MSSLANTFANVFDSKCCINLSKRVFAAFAASKNYKSKKKSLFEF